MTDTKNKPIKESRNYVIVVGRSEEWKRDVYQLRNKITGVIEVETSSLPDIYTYMDHNEDSLALITKAEQPAMKAVLN